MATWFPWGDHCGVLLYTLGVGRGHKDAKLPGAFKFIELAPSYFPCSAQETCRQLSWKENLYIFLVKIQIMS